MKKEFIPFENRIWLSSPTMHGQELVFVKEAYDTNWMSTMGTNINEIEKKICEYVGCKYAVALGTGTSALHMAVKLAGVKPGEKVFCSDLTFAATVNPVKYEGGEPVFIDSEYETWNMDPVALEQAFELYPDVRVVVMAHLYGTPAKMDELTSVCQKHGAVIIEDAAESLGATYKTQSGPKESGCSAATLGQETGTFGKYNAISFNGNKIITGSSGGMFLTDDREAADRVRKWSTQSRENAPWYQHEEIGYNYRMSNVVAGIIRGQLLYLDEHIARKKEVYERYREGFQDLPVSMNPYDEKCSEPNFWLSCLLIDEEAMCRQIRDEHEALYISEAGKSCPTEILEMLARYNAEGRPIWKPMHMQPIYRMNGFVTREGDGRAVINTGKSGTVMGHDGKPLDVGNDIFNRGLCLPSDVKMTEEQQDTVIEMVRSCFE
ncbi:MAG: aminotransferase class I/II-fold pyridoxal phosphate-dependent enzyme [Lachnospiraceae bacterium]|nr:aminotransferase class I/II-fold pyridoxal phosphate-dependent enzyme [Lachnospiraceae bacterium]